MARRRANGEGTVRQRSDGSWEGRLIVGYDQNGKPRYRSIYGRHQRDVIEDLAKLRANTLAGISPATTKQTVASYLERWLTDAAKPKVSESTFLNYAGKIRNHIVPRIGGIQLGKVTPLHIQGLYAELERDGHGPRLVQQVHGILRQALGKAVKLGVIGHNPCLAVDRPKVAKKAMKVLDVDQAGKLLEAAQNDRLEALYVLALTGGLRQGEILGLQWEDVDFTLGTVKIQRSLKYLKGKVKSGPPKTDAGRRQVELPQMAVAALRRHRKQMMSEGHGSPWVFCEPDGKPILRHNLTRQHFEPLLADAAVPKIRFHDLRHTAASLLLAKNEHPKVVQERLGHSTIAVTMDLYSHMMPGMQREAARKYDEMFAPGASKAEEPLQQAIEGELW